MEVLTFFVPSHCPVRVLVSSVGEWIQQGRDVHMKQNEAESFSSWLVVSLEQASPTKCASDVPAFMRAATAIHEKISGTVVPKY